MRSVCDEKYATMVDGEHDVAFVLDFSILGVDQNGFGY